MKRMIKLIQYLRKELSMKRIKLLTLCLMIMLYTVSLSQERVEIKATNQEFKSSMTNSLLIDQDGLLIFPAYIPNTQTKLIASYNPSTGSFSRIKEFQESFELEAVDKQNNIYVWLHKANKVVSIDSAKNISVVLDRDHFKNYDLTPRALTSLFVPPDNSLWYYGSAGIFLLENQQLKKISSWSDLGSVFFDDPSIKIYYRSVLGGVFFNDPWNSDGFYLLGATKKNGIEYSIIQHYNYHQRRIDSLYAEFKSPEYRSYSYGNDSPINFGFCLTNKKNIFILRQDGLFYIDRNEAINIFPGKLSAFAFKDSVIYTYDGDARCLIKLTNFEPDEKIVNLNFNDQYSIAKYYVTKNLHNEAINKLEQLSDTEVDSINNQELNAYLAIAHSMRYRKTNDNSFKNRVRDEILANLNAAFKDINKFPPTLRFQLYLERAKFYIARAAEPSFGRILDADYGMEFYQSALEDLARARFISSSNIEVLLLTADLLVKQREYRQAIIYYTKVLSISPSENPNVYYLRGVAKLKSENYEGAVSDFDKVIELGSNDIDHYWKRAEAKYYFGNKNGSLDDLRLIVNKEPNFGGAYYAIGRITKEINQSASNLCSYFKKAYDLNINSAYYFLMTYCGYSARHTACFNCGGSGEIDNPDFPDFSGVRYIRCNWCGGSGAFERWEKGGTIEDETKIPIFYWTYVR